MPIMSVDHYLVDRGNSVVRIGGSNLPRSKPMDNVIQFPTATDRDTRRLDFALACHDVEAIITLALSSDAARVRARAVRWLAEVVNVRVSA